MSKTSVILVIGLVLLASALGLNMWLNSDVPISAEETPETTISKSPEVVERVEDRNEGEISGDIGIDATKAEEATNLIAPSTEILTDNIEEAAEETSSQEGAVSPEVQGNTVTTEAKKLSIAKEELPSVEKDNPDFDVVRISKEGDAVIAGRAPAGATVTIVDGQEELGQVVADEAGEWVFLPTEPLDSGERELSLTAQLPNGDVIRSENVVILAVPERTVAEGQEEVQEQPLAVLIPRTGGVTKILQKPVEEEGVAAQAGGLILDSIDYDSQGNVTISGRGTAGAYVRFYLNNNFVGEATIGQNNLWTSAPIVNIAPGLYNLRLDQSLGDKVISRIELPFNRAEPITDLAVGDFIIVQPGNSLWRIARRTTGNGFNYTEIFKANQDQIKDPDLIYPGQVFQLPE